MEFSTREANPGDASEIAELHHLVWPLESVDADKAQELLADGRHVAHLATDPLGVVGYADGFTSRDSTDNLRWELDLLAVHPRARRRGVGTALVNSQISAAKKAKVSQVRGLVRLSNRGGHRTFARAGLDMDPNVYHLYTAALEEDWVAELPGQCHLVPVETFTYDGYWLEGCTDSKTVLSVLRSPTTQGFQQLGVLIDPHQIAESDSEGMVKLAFHGAFQWYHQMT